MFKTMSRLIVRMLPLLMLALLARAQATSSVLPPNDQALYMSFFKFHHSLSVSVEGRKALDAGRGVRYERSVAHKLRVRDDEQAKLAAISHQYVADLTKWQDELTAYVISVRSRQQPPQSAVLGQFDQRRQHMLTTALTAAGNVLTPNSWAGLRAFINGEFRMNVMRVPLPAVSAKP